ncbi:MAG TPA: hypothetical protein VJ840_01845, partial [Gemmatimonadaceae bacterium]|nr:hypothetical protein [Gemmatimonadaceae bacterium]
RTRINVRTEAGLVFSAFLPRHRLTALARDNCEQEPTEFFERVEARVYDLAEYWTAGLVPVDALAN